MQHQKWTAAGCVLWIAGLILFITGLNLSDGLKDWMTIIGSIAFLAGLGVLSVIWIKKRREEEK